MKWLRLIRITQWGKNSFVLAPLLFSGQITNQYSLQLAILAMLLFCLTSSLAYVVNDLHDINADRKYKIKSATRPLANGEIKVNHAYLILIGLAISVCVGVLYIDSIAPAILSYLLMSVLYTFIIKEIPLFDVLTIALGFVLRIYAGALSISVPLSNWMLVTVFSLSLYMAVMKRKQELCFATVQFRNVLKYYSKNTLNILAIISAAGAITFYVLYVINVNLSLSVTVPLVIYGLVRYWYMISICKYEKSPDQILFSDRLLLLTVLTWVLSCVIIIISQYLKFSL